MPHRIAVAIAVLLLSACAQFDLASPRTEPTGLEGPWLRTDRAAYDVVVTETSYTVQFQLAYTNHHNRAVIVPACHSPAPPSMQKLIGDEWVDVYLPVMLMCHTPPLVIPARSTHQFHFTMSASRLPNSAPRLDVAEIPGTYRLVWLVAPRDGNAGLPLEQRISNSFELR
jgi:hypothetical protein